MLLAAVVVALGIVVALAIAYVEVELRAPWSGMTLVALAVALILVGLLGDLSGLLLAVAATAALIGGAYLAGGEPVAPEAPGCDPTCGLGFAAALVIALPVVLVLAGVGVVLRRLYHSRRLWR